MNPTEWFNALVFIQQFFFLYMHSESMLLHVDAYQLIFLYKHPVMDNIVMRPKRTRMISNAKFDW